MTCNSLKICLEPVIKYLGVSLVPRIRLPFAFNGGYAYSWLGKAKLVVRPVVGIVFFFVFLPLLRQRLVAFLILSLRGLRTPDIES